VRREGPAADLPVMRPTKFEFVINLKRAKTLGFELSPALQVRARRIDRIEPAGRIGPDFRFWHFCEVPTGSENVCLSGKSGSDADIAKPTRLTHFGPRNFLGEIRSDRGSLLGLILTHIKNGVGAAC
jgi:hypothetical protein